MADTYEKDLAQKSSLTTGDYIRVVGSDNVSYKQLVSDVAQKVIETYTGSSLAGSKQSVKSALDSLKSNSLASLQKIEVPTGSSKTMTIAGHGVLVFMGATVAVRGMYIASGYGSSIEIAEIRAVAGGTFSISGTTMTISNTTNWPLRVAFVRLI